MSDSGSGLELSTATYRVWDEYGVVQPSGPVAVSAAGAYTIQLSLIASRNSTDGTGRQYSVTLTIKDKAGNLGSCLAAIDVPHDKGN
jgi:hypothetical protein